MSIEEFRFKVEPKEDLVTREERWDAELLKLQSHGLTIKGTGPDSDYPVRYAFSADGEMTFEEWWKGNPDEPWYEVYDVQPLHGPDEIALMDAHVAYEEAANV